MSSASASPADTPIGWRFENSYAWLPDSLFAPSVPAKVCQPCIAILNHRLADELSLNCGVITSEAAAAMFAAQLLPDGSLPIAQAYAEHQYGGFTMLGDGRAILLEPVMHL